MRENHRVWAEIDVQAIQHNVGVIRRGLRPGTKVMAVLKANAYGHGAVEVARALSGRDPSTPSASGKTTHIDAIGVGDSQEALELREAGIDLPILVLGAIVPGEIPDVIAHGVQANVHSLEMAEEMNRVAERLKTTAEVQLMIDTGMGRLGLDCYQAVALLRQIRKFKHLQLTGICTHFSSPAETNTAFSMRQLERFSVVTELGRSIAGGRIDVHAASHTAIFKFPQAHFDMVRPGLALYGLSLDPGQQSASQLKRALSLRSQVVFLKDVNEGTPVSYSRMWYAPAPTRIATLPLGYNDGIPVGLTGKLEVLIRGKRCPVVGRITMDYIMVDVGQVEGVALGDVATVVGRDGDEEIKLEDLSNKLGTVPYEITCRLGRRVKRVYHQGGQATSRVQRKRAA